MSIYSEASIRLDGQFRSDSNIVVGREKEMQKLVHYLKDIIGESNGNSKELTNTDKPRKPTTRSRAKDAKIIKSVEEAVSQGNSNSVFVYISGQPGTGKTLCVEKFVHSIDSEEDALFSTLSWINCHEISGKSKLRDVFEKSCDAARSKLQELGHLAKNDETATVLVKRRRGFQRKVIKEPRAPRVVAITILDEIDHLLDSMPEESSTFLSSIIKSDNALIRQYIIGIANQPRFDHFALPQSTIRLPFMTYTWNQILAILRNRVGSITFPNGKNIFGMDALEFCSRDVAKNKSGDMRKALDVCRDSIALASRGVNDDDEKYIPITMQHVSACLDVSRDLRYAISGMTFLQIVLISIVAKEENLREGIPESRVFPMYRRLCQTKSIPTMSATDVRDALNVMDGRILTVFSRRPSSPTKSAVYRPLDQDNPMSEYSPIRPSPPRLSKWSPVGKRPFGSSNYNAQEKHYRLGIAKNDLVAVLSVDSLWKRFSLGE